MPALVVAREELNALLGTAYTTDALEKTLLDFGIELDDTFEEDGTEKYRLDIAANRYDLLCTAGLARALRAFLSIEPFKDLRLAPPTFSVRATAPPERPFIACAVIRDIDLHGPAYASLIDYQEKLNASIGRNRSLAAIGTHDLDKALAAAGSKNPRLSYASAASSEILFTPLRGTQPVRGSELRAFLSEDKKLLKALDLLPNPEKMPVLKCGEAVLAVPPVINAEETKLTAETRNILVDVSGTQFERVNATLKLILYNFRGSSVEAVRVEYVGGIPDDGITEHLLQRGGEGATALVDERGNSGDKAVSASERISDVLKGNEIATPIFYNRQFKLRAEDVRRAIRVPLTVEEMTVALERSYHRVTAEADGETLRVAVPDIRADVMHPCDLIEDVAVAYGFNRIPRVVPELALAGVEDALNKFTDRLREETALCGFCEALTLSLLARAENIVDAERQAVVGNPKSSECEVVRTSLVPGLLKTAAANQRVRLPLRLFEAADVVVLDGAVAEGARNERRLAGLIAGATSMLEGVHGPLSAVLRKAGFGEVEYRHAAVDWLLEGQTAEVWVMGERVGVMGVVHPRVCRLFRLGYAASVFEVDVGALHQLYRQRMGEAE